MEKEIRDNANNCACDSLLILSSLREVYSNLEKLHEANRELKHELKNLRQENQELRSTFEIVLETFRQRNLILRGLQDDEVENDVDLLIKVQKIIFKLTNSKEIQIDTVRRLGTFDSNFNRLVRIVFVSVEERDLVFNCRNRADLSLMIFEDVISGKYSNSDIFNHMGSLSSIDFFGDVEEFDKKFGLAKEDIELDYEMELGRGAFGTVYKGSLSGEEVAVKRPQLSFCRKAIRCLLAELKVHSHLEGSCHVVGFIGAYVKEIRNDVLYVVTELCMVGSLKYYLRSKKRVRTTHADTYDSSEIYYRDLLKFTLDIAKGLEYIGSKKVVHGDLSTRNILLDSKLTCKICDFGLSRILHENESEVETSQDRLPKPWKWMAYEALANNEFSYASDVWSFGVTVWEIFSLGDIPYAGLGWTSSFLHERMNGLRLQCPQFASEQIHSKLMDCWKMSPKERPTAEDIVLFFENMCMKDYTQLVP